jgi:hypothetical protein
MPPVGFELTISAGERPQTYALDRAATGTGIDRQITKITTEKTVVNLVNQWNWLREEELRV